MSMIITIIIFIIILGVLVLVHELGHFITAKRNGIHSHEFGFGFPPRIVGVVKDSKTGKRRIVWGNETYEGDETMYSMNWLPLGGFVRIKGQDGEDKESKDSFANKSIWVRFKVLIAGVVMNLVLAVVLMWGVLIIGAPEPLVDNAGTFTIDPFGMEIFSRYNYEEYNLDNVENGYAIKTFGGESVLFGVIVFDTREKVKEIKVAKPPVVTVNEVIKESVAEEAGIKTGDVINSVCVDGVCQEIYTVIDFQTIVGENAEQMVVIKMSRGGDDFQVEAVPAKVENRGMIGVSLAEIAIVQYKWYEAIWEGLVRVFTLTILIVGAFIGMITSLFTGNEMAGEVAGPVGITKIVQQMKDLGFVFLLQFTAILSVNLAIINAMPIPALDGGRILFLIIEKIKGKPIDEKTEGIINTVSFVILIALIVVVTVSDIWKMF